MSTGIAIGNPDGTIVHANSVWYDIAGFDPESPFPAGMFYSCVMDEYKDVMSQVWQQLITTGERCTFELKIKTRQSKDDAVEDRTRLKWIAASSATEKDDKGLVRFITTCITGESFEHHGLSIE